MLIELEAADILGVGRVGSAPKKRGEV